VHQWSTIDARARGSTRNKPSPLLIVADGRELRLDPEPTAAHVADDWRASLGQPEDTDVITAVYPIDAESLRFLATSARVSAVLPQVAPALPYGLWRDGRQSQLRLLEAIGS
jgi:hypothetical protein